MLARDLWQPIKDDAAQTPRIEAAPLRGFAQARSLMSDSRRNQDFYRLRALAREMTALLPAVGHADGIALQTSAMASAKYRALQADFDRIWRRYGFKSMVMDRRRRGSTRKANQKAQRSSARADKRSGKDRLRRALIAELSQ